MTKFITTYQVGRKCRNKLAEAVWAGLERDLLDVINHRLFRDAKYWRESIRYTCKKEQERFPKCKPIYISEHKSPYDGEGNCSFHLYHNSGDTTDEGSFLTIKVISEEKYYTPQFNRFIPLNKQCEHLWVWARANYPNWRGGVGAALSAFYIHPIIAKDEIVNEWAKDAYNAKTEAIIEQGENTITVKVKTPKTVNTAFTITFKPLWQ